MLSKIFFRVLYDAGAVRIKKYPNVSKSVDFIWKKVSKSVTLWYFNLSKSVDYGKNSLQKIVGMKE